MDDIPPYTVGIEKELKHFVVVVHELDKTPRKARFIRKEAADAKAAEELARLKALYD